MTEQKGHSEAFLAPNVPEVLTKHHAYTVVMPYSSNLKEHAPQGPKGIPAGEARLSFYSALVVNAAYELFVNGDTDKIILCGETTFGDEKKSTTELQKEALLRMSKAHSDKRQLTEADIISLSAPNLNNTAFQIEAVAKYQKDHRLTEPFLILDWQFHDQRIKNHVKGYNLNADTVAAEAVRYYYSNNMKSSYNFMRMRHVLPEEEFEQRERMPRRISRFDKKGLVPKVLTKIYGGSVTDIRHTPHGLELENTTGKKKLEEVANKAA